MMRLFLIFRTSRGIREIWAVCAKRGKTIGEMMRTAGIPPDIGRIWPPRPEHVCRFPPGETLLRNWTAEKRAGS